MRKTNTVPTSTLLIWLGPSSKKKATT